jgi:predicted SnoaL-like aldol condensation-catalyzing enzyme
MRGAAAVALAIAAIGAPAMTKPVDGTERNRALMTVFAQKFYGERDVRGAFEAYVAADYIQHNPGIADGRDAAIKALEPLFSRPGAQFDVKRIIVDGDMAVIHLRGRSSPSERGGAVADIYRLKDGKIVEHWDVIQPIAETTISPHPYF